jgi:polyferredoxin
LPVAFALSAPFILGLILTWHSHASDIPETYPKETKAQMRSTESDSREWYVEKLWIVPALALLLPPLAFVLTFSRLIPLGVFLPLLITLAVGMVTLLAMFILMMNGGANLKNETLVSQYFWRLVMLRKEEYLQFFCSWPPLVND